MRQTRSAHAPHERAVKYCIDLRHPATLLSLVCVLTTATFINVIGVQGQAAYRLLSREGVRPLPVVTVSGQEFVAVDDLVAAFGLTAREDRLAGGITLTAGSRTIIITPDQPVVSVAGRLVSLSAAPVRQNNRWLLPLDILTRAVGPSLDTRVDVRRPTRLIVLGDTRVPRVATRIESSPSGTTITFDSTPAAPARVSLDAGRLTVTFEADALDLTVPAVQPQDFLQSVQPADAASVRLMTGPRFAVHRATTSQPDANTSRIVIELLAAGAEPPAPVAPASPSGVPAPSTAAPAPPPLVLDLPTGGIRTVVIDAGHGGDEPGTRGAGGTLEKDVTIGVARRLRAMIESRLGLRVFLTRDDDRTLALDDRSAYANSQKADLFLSLHANASLRPALQGAEVYSLSPGDAPAAAGADGVMLPALGGGSRLIDLIPWENAQARYVEQSATFASLVEQALRGRVPMSPRARQQGPFRVLVGANMPAVLVELGYLSNAAQEKSLASPAGQDQVALALFDAIVAYRAQTERAAAPAARPQP